VRVAFGPEVRRALGIGRLVFDGEAWRDSEVSRDGRAVGTAVTVLLRGGTVGSSTSVLIRVREIPGSAIIRGLEAVAATILI
jgi:hypothetical protein